MNQYLPAQQTNSFELALTNSYYKVSLKANGDEAVREFTKAIVISVAIVSFAYIMGKALES